jgi:hypothetical protein
LIDLSGVIDQPGPAGASGPEAAPDNQSGGGVLPQISDNMLKTLAILFAADRDSGSLMISPKTVLSCCLEE